MTFERSGVLEPTIEGIRGVDLSRLGADQAVGDFRQIIPEGSKVLREVFNFGADDELLRNDFKELDDPRVKVAGLDQRYFVVGSDKIPADEDGMVLVGRQPHEEGGGVSFLIRSESGLGNGCYTIQRFSVSQE